MQSGTSPGGDFYAQISTGAAVPASLTTLVFDTVKTGNSGGWYATGGANPGRFTPPAGRFYLYAGMTFNNGTASATQVNLALFKNGVGVSFSASSPQSPANGAVESIVIDGTFDANGTDFFEIKASQTVFVASYFASQTWFGAFPISGIQGPPGPPGTTAQGDFFATHPGIAITSTPITLVFNTVQVGNAGGFYSVSTGRYTPPAGRYAVSAGLTSNTSSANANVTIQLRKNGTAIPGTNAINYSLGGGSWGTPVTQAIVDFNGTDWVDVQGSVSGTATTLQAWFLAFPITGIAGPQGPMPVGNYWRQLGRIVPVAGQPFVDFVGLGTIPADINDLQCIFDVSPTTNDVDFVLQMYDSAGVLDTASGRYIWSLAAPSSTQALGAAVPSASATGISNSTAIFFNYSQAGNKVANLATAASGGIRGEFTIPCIRDTTRGKGINYRSNYVNGGNTLNLVAMGGGQRTVTGSITGFRLTFGGTFAAGGSVTLWGSP